MELIVVFIILCIVLLLLISVLFCSVKLYFSFTRYEGENATKIKVKYLLFNKAIPIEKQKKEQTEDKTKDEPAKKGIKYYLDLYKDIKDDVFGILDYVTKKAGVFENINIKLNFGFSNPAHTGVMTGALNGVIYNIMAYFHNNFTVKNWDVCVNPDFENEKFDVVFDCIVKLKTVHIINILFNGLKIFKKMRKNKKGKKANG